ncbi:MAG: putative Ig domain-containing protein [Gemmataceae bacterium]|nr:putative Ig domain-containing protein [Gemmataceae bacterium]
MRSRRCTPKLETLEERLALNSAPVAVGDSYTVFANSALVRSAGVLANDTDADGDRLSVVAVNGSSSAVGQTVTLAHGSTVSVRQDGWFAFAAASGYSGTETLTYAVGDGTASSTATVTFNISSENVYFPGIATKTSRDGDTISVSTPAYDMMGHSLTFAAEGLPQGLSINASTGWISGTIPPGATSYGGPNIVTVTASDGTRSASQVFAWQVDTRISVTQVSDRTGMEGDAVTLPIYAGSPGGTGAFTYSASGLPDGLAISATTGQITGTIAAGAGRPGDPYMTTVTVTDGTFYGVMGFQWTVMPKVAVAPIADQTAAEGATFSLQASASIPGGGTLTFSATSLPVGLSISTSGLISGTVGANSDFHDGAFVTVSATNGTYTGTTEFLFTATPHVAITAIADQSKTEGDTVSLQVSASSAGASSLAYSATGLPPGLAINASTGAITGTISPQPDDTYDSTVTVTDGTYTASIDVSWDVAPRVAITAIADQAGSEGDSVFLQVVADAGGGTMAYSATGLPNGLSISSSTGLITGTLTSPPLDGADPVVVTVSSGSFSSSVTFAWTVTPRVAITQPDSQSSLEGDSVSLQVVATVPGGGTMSYAATGLPTGLAINTSTGLITGTISAGAASGTACEAVVTVTQGSSSARMRFYWAVSPRVEIAFIADQTSVVGGSVSLAVAATIPGGGSLAYSVTGLPSGVSINSSTGAISGSPASGTATQGTPLTVTVTASQGSYSATRAFNVERRDERDLGRVDGAVCQLLGLGGAALERRRGEPGLADGAGERQRDERRDACGDGGERLGEFGGHYDHVVVGRQVVHRGERATRLRRG